MQVIADLGLARVLAGPTVMNGGTTTSAITAAEGSACSDIMSPSGIAGDDLTSYVCVECKLKG